MLDGIIFNKKELLEGTKCSWKDAFDALYQARKLFFGNSADLSVEPYMKRALGASSFLLINPEKRLYSTRKLIPDMPWPVITIF